LIETSNTFSHAAINSAATATSILIAVDYTTIVTTAMSTCRTAVISEAVVRIDVVAAAISVSLPIFPPSAIQRPRTRSVAARQVSNAHERDFVTNKNVQFRPFSVKRTL